MKIVHTRSPAPKFTKFADLACGAVFTWHVDGRIFMMRSGVGHYVDLDTGILYVAVESMRASIVYPQDVELVVKGPLIP